MTITSDFNFSMFNRSIIKREIGELLRTKVRLEDLLSPFDRCYTAQQRWGRMCGRPVPRGRIAKRRSAKIRR